MHSHFLFSYVQERINMAREQLRNAAPNKRAFESINNDCQTKDPVSSAKRTAKVAASSFLKT